MTTLSATAAGPRGRDLRSRACYRKSLMLQRFSDARVNVRTEVRHGECR